MAEPRPDTKGRIGAANNTQHTGNNGGGKHRRTVIPPFFVCVTRRCKAYNAAKNVISCEIVLRSLIDLY